MREKGRKPRSDTQLAEQIYGPAQGRAARFREPMPTGFKMAYRSKSVSLSPAFGLKTRGELAKVMQEGQRTERPNMRKRKRVFGSDLCAPQECRMPHKFKKNGRNVGAVMREMMALVLFATDFPPSTQHRLKPENCDPPKSMGRMVGQASKVLKSEFHLPGSQGVGKLKCGQRRPIVCHVKKMA